jgi:hypothetical protein
MRGQSSDVFLGYILTFIHKQLIISSKRLNGTQQDWLRRTAMSINRFDEVENETEEFSETPITPEASPSTKLERRRKIEDLFEEKRLREELAEFG